jgi:hypothetical protein
MVFRYLRYLLPRFMGVRDALQKLIVTIDTIVANIQADKRYKHEIFC